MATSDAFDAASLDGLPAFFTNGSVDDGKYESLLADLRAHDLLGPVEGAETTTTASGGSSSLFFNDAFSAVFTGSFQSSAASSDASRPGRAPPGLGASDEDLQWTRSQQQFSAADPSQRHGENRSHAHSRGPPGMSLNDQEPELDESQVPGLQGLGLDDDESVGPPTHSPPQSQSQSQSQPPAPPLPQAPQPPLPPHSQPQAWTTASPPPFPPLPPQGMYGRGPPPPMGPQFYGRGPPPPPMGMNTGPFPGPMHLPPPMQMQPPPLPRFQLMTPRDVNFVMQQQMKQLRSSDPFSDDYYFHNYVQKRSRGAAGGAGGPGVGRGLPLPSWKLQHVKSVDPRDAQREIKSRNWESEFHVLGRNAKSSLYRPKQLLNLSASSEATASVADAAHDNTATAESSSEAGADAETQAGAEGRSVGRSVGAQTVAAEMNGAKVLRMSEADARRSVFANETWRLRLALDRGMACLLALQDARHLLDARGVNVQQFHALDTREMDPALAQLRTRTTALLQELAALLGVSVSPSEATNANATEDTGATGAGVAVDVMTCDEPQLHRLLAVAKGRTLVSRALPLLHPSARFVLLPYVVAYLLAAGDRSAVDADGGDDRLCQTLVLLLLYVPPSPSAELLTECLGRAMAGHDIHTLATVLHHRARAEALQALLQRGGQATQQLVDDNPATADEGRAAHAVQVQRQWEHLQGVFVTLATAIKQQA